MLSLLRSISNSSPDLVDTTWFHLPLTKPAHDTFFVNAEANAPGSAQYLIAEPEQGMGFDAVVKKEADGQWSKMSRDAYAPFSEQDPPEYKNLIDPESEYSVEVEVKARYSDPSIKEYLSIQPVQKPNDEGTLVGVVLSVKSHIPLRHYRLNFEVTVRFPPSLNYLHRLLSSGRNWSTTIPSLSSLYINTVHIETHNAHIFLNDISLNSLYVLDHNGKVEAQNISADDIIHIKGENGSSTLSSSKSKNCKVENHNASITIDEVNVQELLEIVNSSGQEKVKAKAKNMKVVNQNGSIKGTFKVDEQLNLSTTNGSQDVKVEILDSIDSSTDGVHVASTGLNGSITLTYISQPKTRLLYSKVTNQNGSIRLQHAPEFEGDFKIDNKMGGVKYDTSNKNYSIASDEKTFPAGRKVVGKVWNGNDEYEKGGLSQLENLHGSISVEL